MTERQLAALLQSVAGNEIPATPEGLAALERIAADRPGDPRREGALLALHERLRAAQGPPVIGGVRRERLVRWDLRTTTWIGTDAGTRQGTMIRVLRPQVVADPVVRRWLVRQGSALRPMLHTRLLEGGDALATELPGPVAASPRPSHPDAVRWWADALGALAAWEAAGRGLPALAPDELRVGADGLQVVCLTPGPDDMGGALASLAAALHTGEPGLLGALLGAIQQAPPRTVGEAVDALAPALASALASERHHLVERWEKGLHGRRAARLLDAVQALSTALRPPEGRTALDADQWVETRGHALWWGTPDGESPVFDPERGFDAPLARRLLRTWASLPPLAHNTPSDAVSRWVAAALRLRTVRMLLERAG